MKYKSEAVLTIELSLLMPGIMAVFIFIIFASFYLHDKCVIARACYKSCKINCYIDNKDLLEERVINDIDEVLSTELFSKWEYSVKCEIREDTLIIIFDGKVIMAKTSFFYFFDKRLFNVKERYSVYRVFEPDYVLGY